MRAVTIESKDGTKIAARIFEPDPEIHRPDPGSVVIGGAMGVRQDFYAAFARWLATQGWRVTTFDYRGAGDSAPKSLRGFRADLFDWAHDYEAVVDHAHAALPGRRLYLLGHSLGAQLPGLFHNQHKIDGMLSVAAGSGYWRDNAPQLKRYVLYFWFVLVPFATRVFGYFPGRKLKKVGDLPAGVVMQWRKWCLSPRYSVSAEGEAVRQQYANARFPVHALSITDDELMTLRGTRNLIDLYENSPRSVERISPADAGVRRLGHFGPFRSEHETHLWPRLADWLAGLHSLRNA
jgi:predicted alpha/beta hydrolase